MCYFLKCYTINIKVTKPILFDYFPGFVLRNALLGAMLECYCKNEIQRAENCYCCSHKPCIYETLNLPNDNNKGKNNKQLYAINTDDIIQNKLYAANDLIAFKLLLFEPAVQYLYQWVKAIEYLGEYSGVGKDSGRFKLNDFFSTDIIPPKPPDTNISRFFLYFPNLLFSPVTVKQKINQLQSFNGLIKIIQNRINQLALSDNMFPMMVNPADLDEIKTNCDLKKGVIEYPKGLKGNLKFYTYYYGNIAYTGNIAPYMELLYWGSILGIGQLTTAGFGRFNIDYE